MTNKKYKIGVVAPGSRMSSQVAARVQALATTLYPDRTPEIHFHPQCLASHGHFAGDDATGRRPFSRSPMTRAMTRSGAPAAATVPAAWRTRSCAGWPNRPGEKPISATLQPDLEGHVVMLEEVSEAMYRIDRSLFHITSNVQIKRVAGIMLGRCNKIPPNEPDFGMSEEEVARYWCRRSGVPWLGRADIGHDIDNKIVPFGGRNTETGRKSRTPAASSSWGPEPSFGRLRSNER